MTGRRGELLGARYAAVTVSVLALVTIIAFETMAVSTAMPKVTQDLGAGAAYGLAFSLMFTGQLLGIALAGALAALRGPVLTLWSGATLFAIGSCVAGLAMDFAVLLLGRLVAGIGAGLALVAIYVVIGAAYPIAVRPRVFAWVASAWVLPSIIGPLVAAAMTQAWGWRSVFLIIAPLTALASLGITRAGRLLATGPGPQYRDDVGSDAAAPTLSLQRVTGYGLLMTVGAALFQAGTSLPGLPYAALVGAPVAGLALLAWAVPPLMPPGTLRMRRGQPSVMMARFLLMASFNGTVAFAPLMLFTHMDLDLLTTGILLTLASLGWSVGSFVQSRPALANRGPDLIWTGTILLVVTTGWFLVGDLLGAGTWWLGACLALIGLAMGLAVTATSVLALELAPRGGHAAASASVQVADVLGSVIGIAVATAAYAVATTTTLAEELTFPLVWAITTVLAALCLPTARRTAPDPDRAADPAAGRAAGQAPTVSAAAAGTEPAHPGAPRKRPARRR
ncbi:MAG: MFS transporter [Austwickia sp.]|nr:MFS transporter [Austwickia sp.]